MDWSTTIPLVVAVIGNSCADALQALAQRLLTIALALFVVGGVGAFAVTAFAWLWRKRAIGEVHLSLATPLRGS